MKFTRRAIFVYIAGFIFDKYMERRRLAGRYRDHG